MSKNDKKLLKAAEEGDVTRVLALLEEGANPNYKNEDKQAPLHEASAIGHIDVVKALLDHGAKPDVKDSYRKTPLYRASGAGHLDVVRALLDRGAFANSADKYGQTPLYWAAERGHPNVVKELLTRGAIADMANLDGTTPLHWSSRKGHAEVVNILLAHGASVDLADSDGETPLHKAAKGGQWEIVKILMDAGADMHKTLKDGRTARDLGNSTIRALLDAYDENTNVMSIGSATMVISRASKDIKDMTPDLFKTAKSIFKATLDFQIQRENVLATALMVERIMRQAMRRGQTPAFYANQAPDLHAVMEEIAIFLDASFLSTQTWKLQLDRTQQEAKIQTMGSTLGDLQDRLFHAAEFLGNNFRIQVVGTIEDLRTELGGMVKKMENLDQELQLITNQSELRLQMDGLMELAIQIRRGYEHYEHQVCFKNMQEIVELETQVRDCQQKITDTINIVSQSRPLSISLNAYNIEEWMLSSDDVVYDPSVVSSLLGQGGCGTVYKGSYLGRAVAVKRFDQIQASESAEMENLISREIKAWKDISKEPFILTLIGVCTKIQTPILVSELCETNIRRFVRDWPESLLPMVYQFACGLATLHKANIIHRDLKGDNVLVTYQKTVAIADFGLSRTVTTLVNTRTGVKSSGTLNWMSPEQYLTPRTVTKKSDIWSFGMTLWEILSNNIPFRDCSENEFQTSIFVQENDRPEKPQVLAPELEPLWDLITTCWRLDPNDRPSADEIVNYLKTHYSSQLEATQRIRDIP
ncbi:hypothetical protein AeRB84_011912 [Aphanomyces euteiches]|nr:hypothetical protein AeRB84_011912 [Aphanomyces euteiches]